MRAADAVGPVIGAVGGRRIDPMPSCHFSRRLLARRRPFLFVNQQAPDECASHHTPIKEDEMFGFEVVILADLAMALAIGVYLAWKDPALRVRN